MVYQLRDYQKRASDAAVNAFRSKRGKNGILVLPTGSGKSLVIADIASRIDCPLLILQPSKEILEQNYAKYCSYGYMNGGIYSASVGKKEINRVTFAMIGSVINHLDYFNHFKYVLIDECHLVKPSDGMYKRFIEASDRVVIGLTATPYRLYSDRFGGSQLKFITRTKPRVFTDVLYYCQIHELLYQGYLAKLNYYDVTALDMRNVRSNSTGADYNDKSLVEEYQRSGFYGNLVNTVLRLLRPKSGVPRKGILVFTKFVKEAEELVRDIPCSAIVTGTMSKKEREDILKDFKLGLIKVVVNVGVLTCLSEDTEILTKNKGWVRMNEIDKDDMVAQFNQYDSSITFDKPIRIIRNNSFKEDFVSLEGRYTNFMVTHNHKMLYCYKKANVFSRLIKCDASEIVGRRIYIPVSGYANADNVIVRQEKRCSDSRFISSNAYNFRKKGMNYDESLEKAYELLQRRNKRLYKSPKDLTLDECRFIGFWLGDGCRFKVKNNGERFSLTQSLGTPKICKWIESVMDKCGIYYTISNYSGGNAVINGRKCNVNGYRTYHLSKGTGGDKQYVDSNLYSIIPYLQKKGTDLYWGLNRHQYFALMEGLFKADGWHGNGIEYTGQKITGEHKELFDLLQAIGVCRGFRVSIMDVKKRSFNKKQLYCISLRDKLYHQLVNERAKFIKNDSAKTVWCVTMPLGNIVTRRNGKVIIMGNCGFDYPELDTVVMARPTKSLSLWYQIVGRVLRPHKTKECAWVVDMCGNLRRFGRVENLMISTADKGRWCVTNLERQLTNVYL